MLIVPIDEVRAGMKLAAPIVHPHQPDQDLLKSGYVLEEQVVARLRELRIPVIYVDYPGLDDLDRHLAANLSPARQKLYSQIKETIEAAQRRTRPAVSYTDYYTTTRELILTLMSQGQHPVYIEHMSRLGTDMIAHATAVAHLSLLLGIKLERYLIEQRERLPAHHAREVVNLGVGGMLHDMGKLSLPEGLQNRTIVSPTPKSAEDLTQWQSHAHEGYELIRGGVEPSAAAAVLHHHQRWDGEGFPARLQRDGKRVCPRGARIHIFARIIAVADLYDRLATRGDSGERRSNLEVLHEMRNRYASWCDPVVLGALQAVAPPFPPGSILTLSDQTCAVVVDVDAREPYLPTVKRIRVRERAVDESKIDLREPGSPAIVRVGKTNIDGLVPEPPRQVANLKS